MTTIIEMSAYMDCAGCELKIRKALQKLDGVDDIDINMAMQKVTVTGSVDQKKVLKAVRKTGRRTELWQYPYNPQYSSFNQSYYPQQQRQQIQSEEPINYQLLAVPVASSSYNYYEDGHGYYENDYGYYQQPLHSTVIDEQGSAMFSDDNPHACSIM